MTSRRVRDRRRLREALWALEREVIYGPGYMPPTRDPEPGRYAFANPSDPHDAEDRQAWRDAVRSTPMPAEPAPPYLPIVSPRGIIR